MLRTVMKRTIRRQSVSERKSGRGLSLTLVALAVLIVAVAIFAVGPCLAWVEAASLKPPTYGPAPGSTPGSTPGSALGAGQWQGLFQLVPGQTYTYLLTHDTSRNPQRFGFWNPPAARPAPNYPPPTTGELSFARVNQRDEIRFWFDVDGIQGNGRAPNDVRALAGAVLVAALTGPAPMSVDGVRLLATVFQWTQWYDLFAGGTFREGLVWQVSQHPPHRFTADRSFGRQQFLGELTRGRDVILELEIDLLKPLPLQIIAYDGADYYKAVLGTAPSPGLRR